jgi:hypothetical protein
LAGYLLDHGADFNLKWGVGDTIVLHDACASGNITTVNLLLEYPVDLSVVDFNGYEPLHCAFPGVNLDIVEKLLKKGATKDALAGRGNLLTWKKRIAVVGNPHTHQKPDGIVSSVLLKHLTFLLFIYMRNLEAIFDRVFAMYFPKNRHFHCVSFP